MTTALTFRNIEASPDDPVEIWPFEGILAAVERGTLLSTYLSGKVMPSAALMVRMRRVALHAREQRRD